MVEIHQEIELQQVVGLINACETEDGQLDVSFTWINTIRPPYLTEDDLKAAVKEVAKVRKAAEAEMAANAEPPAEPPAKDAA